MAESIIPESALESLPISALRNSVLFPASVVPVNVGPRALGAVDRRGLRQERPTIGVLAQREAEEEDPGFERLVHVGTLARVLKVIRLSSGHYSVVLQGIARMRVAEAVGSRALPARAYRALVRDRSARRRDRRARPCTCASCARGLSRSLPSPPREMGVVLDNVQEPGALADLVASHLPIPTDKKQQIIETLDVRPRLRARARADQAPAGDPPRQTGSRHMVEEEMTKSQRELLAAPAAARDPARARRERQRGRGARRAARAPVAGASHRAKPRRPRAASCRA